MDQTFSRRRSQLKGTLRVGYSMLRRKAHVAEGERREKFKDAQFLLGHLLEWMDGAFYEEEESGDEIEFRQYFNLSSGQNAQPSYPKIRHPSMPDFDPAIDRCRVRNGWLKFFEKTLEQRTPNVYHDFFKPFISRGAHVLLAEFLGELFAGRQFEITVIKDGLADIYREEHFGSCMHDPEEYKGAEFVTWYDALAKAGIVEMVVARDSESKDLKARALL